MSRLLGLTLLIGLSGVVCLCDWYLKGNLSKKYCASPLRFVYGHEGNSIIYIFASLILAPLLYHNILHFVSCSIGIFLIGFSMKGRKNWWTTIAYFYAAFVFIFLVKLLWSFIFFRVFGWWLTGLYEKYGLNSFRSCTIGLSSSLVAHSSYHISKIVQHKGELKLYNFLPIIPYILIVFAHGTALPIGDNSYMHDHLFATIVGFVVCLGRTFIRRITTSKWTNEL